MNMKLTNIVPETITQIQFEIAQKVLNDWLDASGFDIVTELYLTKFKSNYITWEGRMKFLKEPWLSKFKSIIRRIIKGKSIKAIMMADKGHLHHTLLKHGFTQKNNHVTLEYF